MLKEVDDYIFLVKLKEIQAGKEKHRDLGQKIKTNQTYFQRNEAEQVKIVTYKNRIYVTKDLRIKTLKWYRHYLCNLG